MSGDDRVALSVDSVWPHDVDTEEGVVVNWFVREGGRVDEGDSCCEVQVEKVSFDVHAPVAGEMTEIVHGEDDELEREDVLAWLEPT